MAAAVCRLIRRRNKYRRFHDAAQEEGINFFAGPCKASREVGKGARGRRPSMCSGDDDSLRRPAWFLQWQQDIGARPQRCPTTTHTHTHTLHCAWAAGFFGIVDIVFETSSAPRRLRRQPSGYVGRVNVELVLPRKLLSLARALGCQALVTALLTSRVDVYLQDAPCRPVAVSNDARYSGPRSPGSPTKTSQHRTTRAAGWDNVSGRQSKLSATHAKARCSSANTLRAWQPG